MTTSISRIALKHTIPTHCFEKNILTSSYYLLRDLLLLLSAFVTYSWFAKSWLGLIIYWNIYGFVMWCVFVIGHDCGHHTFSRFRWLNDFCGNLCHSILLVPYWPWAFSHKKHHLHHNHMTKDNSHPWLTQKEWEQFNILQKFYIYSPITPFISYFFYLYVGLSDGSHINPFSKLYKNSGMRHKIKCVVSTALVFTVLYLLFIYCHTFQFFMSFYGGCWIVFAFWLFMVTYMQHHSESTVIFDDSNWTFEKGALQTIDRRYGFGIDDFHHNISNCHVIHHLFFSGIPHYHLKEATTILLKKFENTFTYNTVRHKFFLWDFFRLFFTVHYRKWKLFYNQPLINQQYTLGEHNEENC